MSSRMDAPSNHPPTSTTHAFPSGGRGHITHRHIRLYEVRVVAHM